MALRLHKVEETFLNTCKKYNLINSGDKIVVGVSGGPDSISLLHLLNKYKGKYEIELVVAHINHLIREDSTDDEKFVENCCLENNINFFAKRVDVESFAEKNKLSVEDAGRIVRYDFFEEIALQENANKIAIAHNKNDNSETVLLNLIRGSGTKGLEGIRPIDKNGKIIRPLIEVNRKDILDFCEKESLNPRIDSTNSENIYRRNIIRNEIIPKLEELNPNIIDTLSRTSDIIFEENKFVNEKVNDTFNKFAIINHNKICFELKNFNREQEVIQSSLVIKAIEVLSGNRKNIQRINVEDILFIAKRQIGGKEIQINKKIKVQINKGKLEFYLCEK